MAKMVWRSWESTSFLVAVFIVGFVRPVCLDASDSSKKINFSELYATLYHSLCRWLIPPLYTMFMPTTLCHIKYFVECFRWLLYAVLCCFISMWGMFHTLLYTGFMFVFSSIQFFHNLQYYFLISSDTLREFHPFYPLETFSF